MELLRCLVRRTNKCFGPILPNLRNNNLEEAEQHLFCELKMPLSDSQEETLLRDCEVPALHGAVVSNVWIPNHGEDGCVRGCLLSQMIESPNITLNQGRGRLHCYLSS